MIQCKVKGSFTIQLTPCSALLQSPALNTRWSMSWDSSSLPLGATERYLRWRQGQREGGTLEELCYYRNVYIRDVVTTSA